MITAQEMRKLERYAAAHGIIPAELMENAGKQVFTTITETFALENHQVIVFAGAGNNGGDGLVAARHFAEKYPTIVILFSAPEKLSAEAYEQYVRLKDNVVILEVTSPEELSLFHFQPTLKYLFVDALLGIGLEGELRPTLVSAIDFFNQQNGLKVAVDIPSGIHPDTGEGEKYCDVDLIVTFHDLKVGLEQFKEKTVVVDIGIPESLKS